MFFLTIYGANLTAFFLTREPVYQSVPIASFDDLASQTDIKYGFLAGGAVYVYFKFSKNAVDQRIFQAVTKDPSLLVNSNAEGVERVRNENYAFISESTHLGRGTTYI